MRGDRQMLVANFVCRFGDEYVLLDLIDEIVLEAFLKSGRTRTYASATYFFLSPQLIDLSSRGNVEKAIAGRFVKTTSLVREQVFKDGELKPDYATLETAPSAIFVLLLSNHKLLYVRETRDAPSLDAFASTARKFILEAHEEYLDSLKAANLAEGMRISRAELLAQVPRPSVEVVPLSTGTSLAAFISRFETLNTVHIRLIEPNDELDNSSLFQDMRKVHEGTNASSTDLAIKNGSKDGLDKAAVKELLENPAAQGNSKITVAGIDQAGDELRGNNEDFKLLVTLDLNVDTIKQAAIKAYNKFQSIKALLKIPPLSAEMKEKIKKLGL